MGRKARDAQAARQRHLTGVLLVLACQRQPCGTGDIWCSRGYFGLTQPSHDYHGSCRFGIDLEFYGVGAGVDPQLSTEGRGGSDGIQARQRPARSVFVFGGWLLPLCYLLDLKHSLPLLRSTVVLRNA